MCYLIYELIFKGTPITTSLVDALNGNVCQGAVTACCEKVNQVSHFFLLFLFRPNTFSGWPRQPQPWLHHHPRQPLNMRLD